VQLFPYYQNTAPEAKRMTVLLREAPFPSQTHAFKQTIGRCDVPGKRMEVSYDRRLEA